MYQAANFVLKILYMFSDSASPSLIMYMSGIRYKRRAGTLGLLTPLATVIYGLRFIQWWQEQGIEALNSRNSIPAAPIDFPTADRLFGLPEVSGKCSICKSVPTRPAALSTGRIYCESCLVNNPSYKESRKCPITLETVKGYRLIFLDGSS
jgi:hypothetical protein